MKVFFSCKRCLSVVGSKKELEALHHALGEMLDNHDDSVSIHFHSGKQTRFPLVVTAYEDNFTGEQPSKVIIVP